MSSSTAKVPTIETGTATSGISVVRQLAEEQEHHDGDQDDGHTSVRTTSSMVAVTKTVESQNTV